MAARGQRSYSHFKVSDNARVHAGDEIHNHYSENPRWKLLEWLRAPDHTFNHYEAQKKREEGTGLWITREPAHKDWFAGNVPLLWLHGKAGCCKTVLCSAIIDNVVEQTTNRKERMLLYFYFSFADAAKQDYQALLLSLIAQLLQQGVDCEPLEAVHSKNQRHARALEPVFWELLTGQSVVHVVIDGLDESPEQNGTRQEILNGVQALHDRCASARLLFTCRKEPDIDEYMVDMRASIVPIRDHNVDKDVRTYVSREISRHRRLSKLDMAVRSEIESILSAKAGGMFRWAFCQLENIKRLKIWTDDFIYKTLHELPETLDDTYIRILTGIDQMYRKQVVAVLQWLAFVESPLRFDEVIEICVTNVDGEPYVQTNAREAWKNIIGVLFALVQVVHFCDEDMEVLFDVAICGTDDETGNEDEAASGSDSEQQVGDPHLTLAHFSVKEYLISPRIRTGIASQFALEPHNAAHSRAQQCIAYILHVGSLSGGNHRNESRPDVESTPFSPQGDIGRPFYDRAVANWARWQREAEIAFEQAPISGLELVLLRSRNFTLELCGKSFFCPLSDWHLEQRSYKLIFPLCPLCIACALHLPCTVGRICRDSPEIIDVDHENFGTALVLASYESHEKVVDALLSAGANPNAWTLSRTPLQFACLNSNIAIVRALLRAGAWANGRRLQAPDAKLRKAARELYEQPPLVMARNPGFSEIMSELLRAGADVNAQSYDTKPVLYRAAVSYQCDVVDLMIKAGADVNQRWLGSGKTALQTILLEREALQLGRFSSVIRTLELLLDAGADADAAALQPIHVFRKGTAELFHRYGIYRVFFHHRSGCPYSWERRRFRVMHHQNSGITSGCRC